MKIYMNNENQSRMMDLLEKLLIDRVDEEPVNIIVECRLSTEVKDRIKKLPPQTLNVALIHIDTVDNIVDETDYTQYLVEMKADTWETEIDKLHMMDYYQGLPLFINMDSFQKLKDKDPEAFPEIFIDKLLYFKEKLNLYRSASIFLTSNIKLDFNIYNTFVAFMAVEMETLCFWSHIGWVPTDDECQMYGIEPNKVICSMHCVDGGMISDDGVYFCEYKRVKLGEPEDIKTPKIRKNLFQFFKEHKCEGCRKVNCE